LLLGRNSVSKGNHSKADCRRIGREIVNDEVLPHLGKKEEFDRPKGFHIADMVINILNVLLERRLPDDRDHLANKRYMVAGSLLGKYFRRYLLSLPQSNIMMME